MIRGASRCEEPKTMETVKAAAASAAMIATPRTRVLRMQDSFNRGARFYERPGPAVVILPATRSRQIIRSVEADPQGGGWRTAARLGRSRRAGPLTCLRRRARGDSGAGGRGRRHAAGDGGGGARSR